DDAEAAIDLHRPRVAAFHLRQESRRVFLLDQHGANAALAEIDGEGQSDRTTADDEYLRIDCGGFAHTLRPDMIGNSAGDALPSTVRPSRGNPAILAESRHRPGRRGPAIHRPFTPVDQLGGE